MKQCDFCKHFIEPNNIYAMGGWCALLACLEGVEGDDWHGKLQWVKCDSLCEMFKAEG